MTLGASERSEPALSLSNVSRPIEIRRIPWGTPAANELLLMMDAEMGALYASLREMGDPEISALVDAALVVHPEEMIAAVGAFDGDELVGHAAVRPFEDALEVKRVYVRSDYRGQGLSKRLMLALEEIARERGASRLILQTGNRQVEAIALYLKIGYIPIDRFGLYESIPFFLCYGKTLHT
jgi:GNAT superfamily N-acetyltransferase